MGYGCAGAAEQDATPCIVRDAICESARCEAGAWVRECGRVMEGLEFEGRFQVRHKNLSQALRLETIWSKQGRKKSCCICKSQSFHFYQRRIAQSRGLADGLLRRQRGGLGRRGKGVDGKGVGEERC